MRWLAICGVLSACKTTDEGETAPSADLPSSWPTSDDGGSDNEAPDLAVVAQGVDALFALALQLDGGPVVDAYAAMMEGTDGSCPLWYEVDGNTFWAAQCTAESGAEFDGYGFTYRYDGVDLYGDGSTWWLDVIYGEATVTDGSTGRLHVGASVYSGTAVTSDGALVWQSSVLGTVEYNGPEAGGTWLAAEVDPDMGIYAYYSPTYDARYVYLDGQVAGLDSVVEGVSAVDASALAYAAASFGWPCEEPAGSVAVRVESGTWIDVIFDVDPDTWQADGECDGCGGAWNGDDYLGDVCIDPSPLLDWESSPW